LAKKAGFARRSVLWPFYAIGDWSSVDHLREATRAMMGRDIVCIGASAGGLQPLRDFVHELPASLPASVFVVVHSGRDSPGVLSELLRKSGFLPVEVTKENQPLELGHIYVAPPDHHLLVKPNRVRVVRGPRENGFRPAVDPLFRTAASAYRERVTGIVLSGGMHDGTAGLLAIKQAGGVAIVQDPEDAVVPHMPLSALANVEVDHVLDSKAMAEMVVRLASEPAGSGKRRSLPRRVPLDPAEFVADALENNDFTHAPSQYTCPECGGVLWETGGTNLMHFRCHVGHGYSAETLLVHKHDEVEGALWGALRSLEENVSLRRRMAKRAEDRWPDLARLFGKQADDSSRQADVLRKLLVKGNGDETRKKTSTRRSQSKRSDKAMRPRRGAANAATYLSQRE
jgi:two-component system chemotaxis response regulator CheB